MNGASSLPGSVSAPPEGRRRATHRRVVASGETAGRARAPREHGFWVMLAVALGTGFAMQPSWAGLVGAVLITASTVSGAMLIGKRIRKHPRLQVTAALAMGAAPAPIALLGGAEPLRVGLVAAGLATIFVAGAASVIAVLQRARKQLIQARLTAVGAAVLATCVAVLFWYLGHPTKAAAVGITALYAAFLLLSAPSAKRLKRIGISISVAHALSAALLAL